MEVISGKISEYTNPALLDYDHFMWHLPFCCPFLYC
jgi:hypothetical protein